MTKDFHAAYLDRRLQLEPLAQSHLLAFWPKLTPAEQSQLLTDLALLNLDQLQSLSRLAAQPDPHPTAHHRLEPPVVTHQNQITDAHRTRGRQLISTNRIAALTVAGGQGTRLGFPGPKGAFPISPVRNKTLFQLFAESILATQRRYNAVLPWYIMTSPANDAQTRGFFAEQKNFGLNPDHLHFFSQGVMPAFDQRGKILLDQPHRLALSPDGHGGTLLALATSGMLADMAERGIEHISYFQVDNPLVYCVDPAFIGLHDLARSDMSGKTLPKADDLEPVGNFAFADGRLAVIEYSDFPESLARAKNPDGSRRFDAANIAVHLLSRRFIERLTADRARFALPWHRALKKVPFIDPATGRRIEPAEPNAIKLEAFIFDALPLAENPVLLETRREEEFSPLKNATGPDSVETARRDMIRRAARWLESAGVNVPRLPDREPNATLEISPLAALEPDDLRDRKNLPPEIRPAQSFALDE